MAQRRSPDSVRDTSRTRPMTWKAVPEDDRPEVDLLQWIGWLVGGELIVLGLVILSRLGFDDFELFPVATAVGPFHGTRLMGLIVIVLGLVVWFGTIGTADDLGLRVVGAIQLVVGIVWMIEPSGFGEWLAVERADGFHLAAIGAVLVIFSLIPPFRVGRRPAASSD